MDKLVQMQSLLTAISEEMSTNNKEYNDLVDDMELMATTNSYLSKEVTKLTGQLINVTTQVNNFHATTSELKRLKALNPERLNKSNKSLKKRNDELKALLMDSEKGRKETLALYIKAKKIAKKKGTEAFHVDKKARTSISASGFVVGMDGTSNMLKGSPIVIYSHDIKGITRHGMMTEEGKIVWASASNTSPTETDSKIAKTYIEEYCKQAKVKLPS